MNNTLLSAALALCLGGGAADLVGLNLVALPAVRAPRPVKLAPPRARAPLLAASTSGGTALPFIAPSTASVVPNPARQPVAIVEFELSSPRVNRHESRVLLDAVALLRAAPAITVIGHADESGPEALNDRLSAQRAAAVLQRLLESGIGRRRVRIEARGEREPRPDGNSRRVEIFVGGAP